LKSAVLKRERVAPGEGLGERLAGFDRVLEIGLVDGEDEALELAAGSAYLAEELARVFRGPFPLLDECVLLRASLQRRELFLDVGAQQEAFGEFHGSTSNFKSLNRTSIGPPECI
jgi:hypothetical protein